MVLDFKVQNQILTRRDNNKVVRDSQNYLYAKLTCSEDWSGEKTMVFKGSSGDAYNVLLDDEDTCLVPWEVLTAERIYVSAFCGDLITANVVRIDTIKSGYEIGKESRIPTPDIYNQIIEKINDIEQGTVDPEVVAQIVDEYLQDKDFVTEDDVEAIVATYVTEHKDELKGDTGATGPQGPQGPQGEPGTNGQDGADGFSPTVTVKTSTEDTYILTITDANGSYDTPNLKGSGGGGGGEYDDANWVDVELRTGVTADNAKIRRIGNVVYFVVTNLAGTGSNYSFGITKHNIAEKYRPAFQMEQSMIINVGNTVPSIGRLIVRTGGGIIIGVPYVASPAVTQTSICLCWLV